MPQTAVHRPVTPRAHRRLRIILIGVIIVAALPVVAVVALVLAVNPIVKNEVLKLSGKALQVPVAMERARVNIAGGIHFYRFAVGNPREYEGVRAFRCEHLDAATSPVALIGQKIEIEDLLVDEPELFLEFGKSRTNWAALMKNLSLGAPRQGGPPETPEKSFVIHRLRIVKPVIHIQAPQIPKGVTVHLRNIELRDIGNAPGTASKTYVVLAAIFQAILTGGLNEGLDIPGELNASIARELREAVESFGGLLPQSKP